MSDVPEPLLHQGQPRMLLAHLDWEALDCSPDSRALILVQLLTIQRSGVRFAFSVAFVELGHELVDTLVVAVDITEFRFVSYLFEHVIA